MLSFERAGNVWQCHGQAHWLAANPHRHRPQQMVMLAGVMPAYVKSHSQGEYVFDHGWADAWHRAGGHYYPKLQIAVPFHTRSRSARC